MTLPRLLAAACLAAAAGLTALPAEAQGPSFNCARARTFVEKAICTSPSLAKKDKRMSRLYFDRLRNTRDYGEADDVYDLQQAQRRWLARRDRCQTNGCLHEAYDYRISQLEHF